MQEEGMLSVPKTQPPLAPPAPPPPGHRLPCIYEVIEIRHVKNAHTKILSSIIIEDVKSSRQFNGALQLINA